MTGNRPEFDTILESWLDDGPATAPSDLFEAAHSSIPQSHRQRRPLGVAWRSASMFSTAARALVSVAAVAVIAVAGFFLLRGLSPQDGVGSSPSPAQTDVAVNPTPSSSPAPTVGGVAACAAGDLHAAVLRWEGAMGSRIGTVTLTNGGTAACTLPSMNQVQLLDKKQDVLLDSGPAAASDALTLQPGDVVSTLVEATNYCQPQPPAPITVGFIVDGALVVAEPVTPTDTDGLPPCNGNPGSAGSMSMHPWQPGTNPQ
jgi:hypothetical protein